MLPCLPCFSVAVLPCRSVSVRQIPHCGWLFRTSRQRRRDQRANPRHGPGPRARAGDLSRPSTLRDTAMPGRAAPTRAPLPWSGDPHRHGRGSGERHARTPRSGRRDERQRRPRSVRMSAALTKHQSEIMRSIECESQIRRPPGLRVDPRDWPARPRAPRRGTRRATRTRRPPPRSAARTYRRSADTAPLQRRRRVGRASRRLTALRPPFRDQARGRLEEGRAQRPMMVLAFVPLHLNIVNISHALILTLLTYCQDPRQLGRAYSLCKGTSGGICSLVWAGALFSHFSRASRPPPVRAAIASQVVAERPPRPRCGRRRSHSALNVLRGRAGRTRPSRARRHGARTTVPRSTK